MLFLDRIEKPYFNQGIFRQNGDAECRYCDMGAFTYDVSKILANFTPPPLSATVSIERPPDDVSIFQTPPPQFQSDISFSKNPLHSTLIETLNVYLIQLKTERCHEFRGEYINAVVSRIVIGLLDLKQFLPKFEYFC